MQFIYSLAPSFQDLLSSPGYAMLIIFIFLLIKFLKLTSFDAKPEVTIREKQLGSDKRRTRRKRSCSADETDGNFFTDNLDLIALFEQCPILEEVYTPPSIWGRNGHLQTATYGLLGHYLLKRTFDKRHFIRLHDGMTATFDVFEPIATHPIDVDLTLVLCPGIANSSESNYIRTCVHLLQEHGFRCAVLNHIGVLKDVPLTSDRIFSYGGSGEMEAMFRTLITIYPQTYFIGVGFSMGANVLTNCLAKLESRVSTRILLGISVCQGYSAINGSSSLMEWESGRRIYNYIITENMKVLLRRNFSMAVQPHVRSGLVNERHLWSATSLHWLDECYSRRVHGFSSLEDYYEQIACIQHIPYIQIPMVFVNALDDPLVPYRLWQPIRDLCESHPRHAFVLLKHGGHLGFLEGSSLNPRSITWLDRFILQLAEASSAQIASEIPISEKALAGSSSLTKYNMPPINLEPVVTC